MIEQKNEIRILRRTSGFMNFYIPPLMYNPGCSYRLQKKLSVITGVRKVVINKQKARLSLFFDPRIIKDTKKILLEIDAVATPMLSDISEKKFKEMVIKQGKQRVKRLAIKGTNIWMTWYLIKKHWHILEHHWIRYPVRYALPWFVIIYMILIHKEQLKNTFNFE